MKSKICGIPNLEVAKQVIASRPDAIAIYCWTNPEKGRNFTDRETARKVAHLAAQASVDSFYLMYEDVDQSLLDSSAGTVARGGTGKIHDWDISRQIVEQCSKPVWLAGGVRLHNVEDATRSVRPYGIDVETGVQLPDGSKNYPAIQDFIAVVRNFSS